MPLTSCPNCTSPIPSTVSACPHCGAEHTAKASLPHLAALGVALLGLSGGGLVACDNVQSDYGVSETFIDSDSDTDEQDDTEATDTEAADDTE